MGMFLDQEFDGHSVEEIDMLIKTMVAERIRVKAQLDGLDSAINAARDGYIDRAMEVKGIQRGDVCIFVGCSVVDDFGDPMEVSRVVFRGRMYGRLLISLFTPKNRPSKVKVGVRYKYADFLVKEKVHG